MLDMEYYPLTFAAGCRAEVVIKANELYMQEGVSWGCINAEGKSLSGNTTLFWDSFETPEIRHLDNGNVVMSFDLPEAGQYNIFAFLGNQGNIIAHGSIYALEKPLLDLIPLRGDFHVHTSRSDGQQSPADAVAGERRRGMDFVYITDHVSYCTAAAAAELDQPGVIRVYPGEEMHMPLPEKLSRPLNPALIWGQTPWVKGCIPVHLVNAGGAKSVNEMARRDPAGWEKEIYTLIRELPQRESLSEFDLWCFAVSTWAFRKTRENGGLAILPHPYWTIHGRTAISETVREELFAAREFDAMECANSNWQEYNIFGVSAWQRENARKPIAGLGVSDGHNFVEENDNRYCYTIVFAAENSHEAISSAVRQGLCVTVMPAGKELMPLIVGELPLVQYASFLLRTRFKKQL